MASGGRFVQDSGIVCPYERLAERERNRMPTTIECPKKMQPRFAAAPIRGRRAAGSAPTASTGCAVALRDGER
jgi:hypothetical protein